MFFASNPGRRLAVLALALLSVGGAARGQSFQSAHGPSQSPWGGGDFLNYKAGFPKGSRARLAGIGVLANFNWTHSIGIVGRARFLTFGAWNGESEQDYLAGPRYTFLHSDKWRPFASFQAGTVKMHYPYTLGDATFLAMAPGGGVEYRMDRKWSLAPCTSSRSCPTRPTSAMSRSSASSPTGCSWASPTGFTKDLQSPRRVGAERGATLRATAASGIHRCSGGPAKHRELHGGRRCARPFDWDSLYFWAS